MSSAKQPNGGLRTLDIQACAVILMSFGTGLSLAIPSASARPVPDNTLGTESSRINTVSDVRDLIEGGAIRGSNLFHSFAEFNIDEGREAYFANPASITNIFSRVTGNDVSDILGTLGVDGTANLFLLNPNGIIFGPNSQLDIRGSFLASTGNSFDFGDGDTFSAVDPQNEELLTINVPLGVQYGANPAPINVAGDLEVDDDLTLGGGIISSNGQLTSTSGRLLIEGVSGDISFQNSQIQAREEILLQSAGNIQVIDTNLSTNGQLILQGELSISLTNSIFSSERDMVFRSPLRQLSNGTRFTTGGYFITENLNEDIIDFLNPHKNVILADGDITLNSDWFDSSLHILAGGSVILGDDVTTIRIDPNSGADNTNSITAIISNGTGSTQEVTVNASSRPTLDIRAGIEWTQIPGGFPGNINTSSLGVIFGSITDPSENTGEDIILGNGTRFQNGSIRNLDNLIGNIILQASSIFLDNIVIFGGEGDIVLETPQTTENLISIEGFQRGISIPIEGNIAGAGNISVRTGSLNIVDGGQITTGISGFGQGNVGLVSINASEDVTISGQGSFISSQIGVGLGDFPLGNSGGVEIITNNLNILDNAAISTSTFGRGDAGNIFINAREIVLIDENSSIQGSVEASLISGFFVPAEGNSNGVVINSNQLDIRNGSQISTRTVGIGDAGPISIAVNGEVNLQADSAINSQVSRRGAVGNSGDIHIDASTLSIRDESGSSDSTAIIASTFGQGNAGQITLNANSIKVVGAGAGIASQVLPDSQGDGTGIEVNSDFIQLEDNALISTVTFDEGNAGNIDVQSPNVSLQNVSRITSATVGSGNAGNISFSSKEENTPLIVDLQNSFVLGTTASNGRGGELNIIAPESVIIRGDGQILVETTDEGHAGNMSVTSPEVTIQNNIQISAATSGRGSGGNLDITAPSSLNILDNSEFSAETTGEGRAGNVTFTTENLFLQEEARITTSATIESTTLEQGGSITLNASQLQLEGQVAILSETESAAPAGVLTIQPFHNRPSLTIDFGENSNSEISVSTSGSGRGGDLILSAPEAITIDGPGRLTAETTGSGQAGGISITAGELFLNNVNLSTESVENADGGAGNISVSAREVFLTNTTISAEPTNVEEGGNIELQITDTLQLDQSIISASTDDGEAGNLTLNLGQDAIRTVRVHDSTLETRASGKGGAGFIFLNANDINLRNNSRVLASTESGEGGSITLNQINDLTVRNSAVAATTINGTAGQITVTAGGNVLLSGSLTDDQPASITVSAQGGDAGNLSIMAEDVVVRNGAEVSVRNQIDSDAGNLEITANNLFLNRGKITAETESGGRGNIILSVDDTLRLGNDSNIVASTQSGLGGSIFIQEVNNVHLNNSLISSSASTGEAGRLRINASEQIILSGEQIDRGPEGLLVESRSSAGGDLEIRANDLWVEDGALISASTRTGNAGDVIVRVDNLIQLTGEGSELSAQARRPGGEAGNLVVAVERLIVTDEAAIIASNVDASLLNSGGFGNITLIGLETLEVNNGLISASTENGDAGQITLNQNQSGAGVVRLRNGRIETLASESGNAGGVELNAQTLFMSNASEISATTQSGIGGSIFLSQLDTLELDIGSRISAQTQVGQAGSLFISASDQIILRDRSSLSVEAAPVSANSSQSILQASNILQAVNEERIAGGLILRTNELNISGGSSVTVSSPDGQAGNISLNVNQILLDSGTISAEAGQNLSSREDAATLTLSGLELLILQENSLISAEANGDASGGNIVIDAEDGFVVADVFENSDIIATAVDGDGGNIEISTIRIFGMQEASGSRNELRNNTTNDISASSQFGTDGVIAIEDLGVDPVQAAAELPTVTGSPPLSQGCQPGIDGSGRFINTEQGGIPPNPSDPLDSGRGWEDVYPADDTTNPHSIIEADTWHVNEQGRVVLQTHALPNAVQLTCQS